MSDNIMIEEQCNPSASTGESNRPQSELTRLRAQLADFKTIQQDNIDAENEWRAAAGPWDKSDSFCTESAATVIERLRAQLQEYKEALAKCTKQLGDFRADRIQK